MNFSRIVSLGFALCATSLFAAAPTGPIDGDYEVTVASGETETWSGDISGTGRVVKNGAGTLVLSGNNTFTGGIQINKGVVRVDAEKAIGSGTVTLSPASAAAADVAQLYINCAGTFANDIVQTADGFSDWNTSSDATASILILSTTSATVTFNGNITSAGNINIRPKPANTGTAEGTGATTTFNGALSAPGKTIVFQFYGKPTINGKVTCNLFTPTTAWSGGAELKLANADNQIGTIRLRNGNVRATQPGALGGAALKVETAWESQKCNFYLDDNPQSVARLVDDSGTLFTSSTRSDCGMVSSGYPVTLTVTGMTGVATSTTKQNLNGALNLCLDAPNFTQTFSTRTHAMRGNITVNRGTMKVTGTASFRNVPAVTVGVGGTLMVESTTNACFEGVKSLTLEGAFSTTRTDTFANGLSLFLGTNARLTLPAESTLTVGALIVNGAFLPAGTYSEQYGITGGSVTVVPSEYVINVPAGETNTVDMLFTEAVPSIRKIGAGGLILSNTESTFSGGIDLDEGTLVVNGAETLGLGTGPVRINGTAGKVCQISFLGNTTFTNDIIHAKSSVNYPGIFIATLKQVTLTGSITSSDNMYIWNDRNGSDSSGQGPTTVFKGPVTAAGKTLTLRTYGTMDFYDKIVCDTLTCTPNWSAMGRVLLRSSENEIAIFEDCAPAVECYAENAILGAALSFNTTDWTGGGPKLLMGTNHQSIASLATVNTTLSKVKTSNQHFHRVYANDDNTPLTLTLTGEATSRSTYAGIEGNISLVLDAEDYPGFVQTFNGLNSTTKGNVVVKNGTLAIGDVVTFANVPEVVVEAGGTLRITSTESVFPSVAKLVVDGKLVITSDKVPFTCKKIDLELGADAELTLPEGMQLTFQTVKVDGRVQSVGTYTPANLPQLKSGSIVAAAAGDLEWTAGGGADVSFATVANWDDDDPLALLRSGAVGLVFAQAGTRAEIDEAYDITHLTFDAPGDFTLAGTNAAAALTLGSQGLEIARGTQAKTATLADLAFTVAGSQTWTVPTTNETLRIKDAFQSAAALEKSLSVAGAGRIVLEGTNVLAGGIKLKAPGTAHDGFTAPTLKVTGLLATPDHVDQGAAGDNDSSIYFDLDHDGNGLIDVPWGLRLANAVIEKPIAIKEQMGERCLTAEIGTTNTLKGELAFVGSEWTRVELLNRSEVTCRGGIKSLNHGLRLFGAGTLLIRDSPVVFKSYSGLNPTGNTTVDVGVTGNDFNNICLGYEIGFPQMRFSVSEAMTNGQLIVGFNSGYLDSLATHILSSGTYTVDLGEGTTQRCAKVAMSSRSVLKGQYPAMLEVYGNLPRGTDEEKVYKIAGAVQGGVGVKMCGTGTLLLDGGALASSGDLAVSSGTLELAAGTTWRNGRKAYVSGTGTLKVNAGDAFASGQMDIYVSGDDWKLDIPEGQTLAAHSLIDLATGRAYVPGIYGNAASGAAKTDLASHFTGNGRLQLRRTSTTLSFR